MNKLKTMYFWYAVHIAFLVCCAFFSAGLLIFLIAYPESKVREPVSYMLMGILISYSYSYVNNWLYKKHDELKKDLFEFWGIK